eukprot:963687-Amphidinium_carterae.1
MSERWGREVETEDEPNNKTNHITSVATLAMSATFASRTWIIDTGAAQHRVGRSYLSKDELQSIYTVTPVSLTTANDIVKTSSR